MIITCIIGIHCIHAIKSTVTTLALIKFLVFWYSTITYDFYSLFESISWFMASKFSGVAPIHI